MRQTRDSFLHFLADNLTPGLVHALRRDPDDPSAGNLKMNSVNVQFLDAFADTVSTEQAVIDVIFDDENAGVDAVETVSTLLRAAYFTPLLDYTVPASPTDVGCNVAWDRKDLKFKSIYNDNYCHYSCTLLLQFYSR